MSLSERVRKKRNVLIAFPFVAIVVTVVGSAALGLPRTYSLVQNACPTTGVVVSKDAKQHQTVYFRYEVERRSFTSAGSAENAGSTFSIIQIGQVVSVIYDVTDPGSATMASPTKVLGDKIFIMELAICGVTLNMLMLFFKGD